MLFVIILLPLIIVITFIAAFSAGNKPSSSDTGKHTIRTRRGPNCGETATVHGNTWECGWCGDHGFIK